MSAFATQICFVPSNLLLTFQNLLYLQLYNLAVQAGVRL